MADFVQLKHPEYQSMHARPDGEVREETADIESRCTTSTGGGDDGGVRVGTWMNQGLLRVSQARNGMSITQMQKKELNIDLHVRQIHGYIYGLKNPEVESLLEETHMPME